MLLCEIDSLSDALSLGLLTPDELADQCSETQMAEKLKGLTNDTYHIQLDEQDACCPHRPGHRPDHRPWQWKRPCWRW